MANIENNYFQNTGYPQAFFSMRTTRERVTAGYERVTDFPMISMAGYAGYRRVMIMD